MIKFYIFIEKNIKPVILLVGKIITKDQEKLINDICISVFELLYEQKIVNSQNILVFLLLKDYNNKKSFYVQGSTNSSPDLINALDNNKFVEKLSFETLTKSYTSYVLNFILEKNKISYAKLKEKKENLSFLASIWLE